MSDAAFPITVAQIVALFMESIFYGIYLVTLGHCLKALLCKKDKFIFKSRREIKWIMVIVAFLMATFATLDVAFGLRHNLDAFIYYTGPGGATAEFGNITYWVNVMKTVDYIAQTAIGDGMLIYRLYIIYNKSWKMVVLPLMLWVTTTVCGSGIAWVEVTTKHSALLNESSITPWIDSFLSFTLVVNLFVTSLIIGKLWKVRERIVGSSSNPDKWIRVMRIILDSGLMYTLSVVIFFATSIAGNNAQYGVSDVVVQIIGITFNLIIIRVNSASIMSSGIQYPSTVIVPNSGGGIPLRNVNKGHVTTSTFAISTEVGVDVEVVRSTDGDSETKDNGSWKRDYGTDAV
ncbi:hypothetical protein EW026_g4000 [Hermanssonia centrifuga]|uniref:Uncharacterized protein n=1 Tax=Hermanssonia centrifuga TaxID=98765 RepID=A0A4S4KN54_9APHY|nr:hypothetical protein EW026_g4000 [Hermanssonia centrifuga]